MKLIRFDATAVHGYMNFNVAFNENITILIGANGVGKTTALRLVQALLVPSLVDLVRYRFETASVVIDDGTRQRTIFAKNRKGELNVGISDVEGSLTISTSLLAEIEEGLPPHRRERDAARALRIRFFENPVYQAIQKLSSPLFLGLDRRSSHLGSDDKPLLFGSYGSSRHGVGQLRRGAFETSLDEVQGLVTDAYRRARRLRDVQLERFKKKLLLSSLSLTSTDSLFEGDSFKFEEIFEMPGRFVTERRRDLRDAFVKIGIDESEVESGLAEFFGDLGESIRRSSQSENLSFPQLAQLISNYTSLIRVERLISEIDAFEKKIPLENKFKSFVSVVNAFFKDSRKELLVDVVGLLSVRIPSKEEVDISVLSSGEQQILLIFGHLFFNSFGARSNIFVVDEPEVSLHLKWQNQLVDMMARSNERAQIVIATHSPEVVSSHEERLVYL